MTIGKFPKPLHTTLLLITLTVVSAAAARILGSNPEPPALTTIGLEAEQDDTDPTPTTKPPTAAGRQFYVSPQVRPNGAGSQTNPWDMWKAMSPGVVPAGSTVYLRGGTYDCGLGRFYLDVGGTPANPTIIRNYPGERPIFDIGYEFWLRGSNVHYYGIEFTDNNPLKVFNSGWAANRSGQFIVDGDNIKVINCIFHDISHTQAFVAAVDYEMYGNLMYYMGFIAPERSWGNTIYTQNITGRKDFTDNIMFQQFNHALQVYGSGAATIKDVYMDGNTIFYPGTLGTNPAWNAVVAVGEQPVERIRFSNNYVYASTNELLNGTNVVLWGSGIAPNRDLTFTGNQIVGGFPLLRMGSWAPIVSANNRMVGGAVLTAQEGALGSNFNWNNNAYYTTELNFTVDTASDVLTTSRVHPFEWGEEIVFRTTGTLPSPLVAGTVYTVESGTPTTYTFKLVGVDITNSGTGTQFVRVNNPFTYGTRRTFAEWQAQAGESGSTHTIGRPTGTDVFIRPNKYEQGRANITIFNWDLANTANINLALTTLVNGQEYAIRDAQNWFGSPIYTGIYSESSPIVTVTLPGTNSPVTPIHGAGDSRNVGLRPPVHTSKEFNAFVVLRR